MKELAAPDNELTIGAPKHCRAGSGGTWIAEAWRLFKSSWLEFLVAFVITFVLAFAAGGSFRLLGWLFSMLISPALSAGFLTMAHKAWREEDPQIVDLFSGFRSEHWGKWVKLIYLKFLVVIVMGLVMGVLAIPLILIVKTSYVGFKDVALLQQIIIHPNLWILAIVALLLVLVVLVSCAMWLSTPLLWFTEVGVIEALSLSMSAAGRNAGALTVFSLLMIVLVLFALVPIGLGLLIIFPLGSISNYVAFRQIFVD